ncbi:MAG TPA: M48 family metalloprotease [Gammaproteobacteria bacterium]
MPEPTFRLVFQGKIAPNADLDEVKGRLQQLFKKDAAAIDKLFSGKKVTLKQGLTELQAGQYREKMQALGVLCDIESQAPTSKTSPASAATPVPPPMASPAKRSSAPVDAIATSGVNNGTTDNSVANIPATAAALKLADIDKAFTGAIPQVELPNSYKAAVVAVGITMLLLPVIYVGLIALLGYGVLSHATSNVSWIQSLGYKFGVVAYSTPIIAGVTVILFMVKPLFARPAAVASTITLDPLKEPIFFHFVNKIALAVGAPRPRQIEVDCQVNAAASFRKGLLSFFGHDLVLTIGMPLLSGFNARQLAGVLAHEFGHFSQGVGMRFHYLTYKVNSWFFYAVYLRDHWDEKLNAAAEEADGWFSIILNFARGGVWATRRMLYVFMMAGQAVSSYMLRQMEFDADRYEAQMAGSEQFKNTTLQLQRLGVAFQVSQAQLAQAWEDKKLVDNFPRLIAHNAMQLPDELDHALLNQMREAKTQLYDSHPSDNERIDNAMGQQARGVFDLSRQSSELFKSFDALAKQVSNSYYAHELGLEFDRNKLVDVNQIVHASRENEKQQESYHQYFKDMTPVFELPVSVNIFDTSKVNWDELLDQYQSVNEQIADQVGQRRQLMHKVNDSYDKYQKLLAIDIFRDCGFVLFPEWFGMDEQAFAKYREKIPKLAQSWQQAMVQLQQMFELNDQRLSIALTLLNHPELIGRNADHASHLKARNRWSLLINNFKRNTRFITDFEFKHFKLAALLSCAPLMEQKPAHLPAVTQQLLEEAKQSFEQLSTALGRLDYPFVAEGEHLTIADYLADFLPQRNHCANECVYYVKCGEIILEKLEAIYARIISGLASVALTIDRLIPTIHDEQQFGEQGIEHIADRQVAAQQTAAAGSLAGKQANLGNTPIQEPIVTPEVTLESSRPQQTSSLVVANKSAAADSAMIGAEPEIKPANKAELAIREPAVSTDAAPEKIPVKTATAPRAKAVFAIDDPMDNAELKEQPKDHSQDHPQEVKKAAALVAQSNGKAVFAIDASTDAAPAGGEPENNDGEAVSAITLAAVNVIEQPAAPAIQSAHEQPDPAALSLESPGVPESTHTPATDDATAINHNALAGKPVLSLEPIAITPPMGSPAAIADAPSISLATGSVSQQEHDALVMESKAQVLPLAPVQKSDPAVKPNLAVKPNVKPDVSGKPALEPVNQPKSHADSREQPSDNHNKDSDLLANG